MAAEVSNTDVEACIRVLKALQGRAAQVSWGEPPFAELKKTVRQFNLLFEKQTFGGVTMEEYVLQRIKKQEEALKKARIARLKQLDKNYINNRQLRADRIQALNSLTEQGQNLLNFVPETPLALEDDTGGMDVPNPKRRCTSEKEAEAKQPAIDSHDAESGEKEGARSSRSKKGFREHAALFDPELRQEADAEVEKCLELARGEVEASMQQEATEHQDSLYAPRSCYTCKRRFHQLHHFYDQLCPECADLNWKKRNQTADLRGRIALLTGGRVKIGFECGLKLLRCGCRVIITTRFPHDCAKRYSKVADYAEWSSRLEIFGLDLRDLAAVTNFTKNLVASHERLDFIINNAAQTVRRPPAYYKHLMAIEMTPREKLPSELQDVIRGDGHSVNSMLSLGVGVKEGGGGEGGSSNEEAKESDAIRIHTSSSSSSLPSSSSSSSPSDAVASSSSSISDNKQQQTANATTSTPAISSGANGVVFTEDSTTNKAAALSQLALLPQDCLSDPSLFPEGHFDVTGQQLDLRTTNSWTTLIDQVEPSEAIECLAINTMAPFILNGKLKQLMLRTPGDKYIINVSAMEGKFYRHKGPQHPHTNMAKAALNMITRTCAQDYARSRIYMNSVDTGWINDENPHESASRIAEDNNFQTPIDEIDAMARILDPILEGVNSGVNPSGLFLKDFNPTEW